MPANCRRIVCPSDAVEDRAVVACRTSPSGTHAGIVYRDAGHNFRSVLDPPICYASVESGRLGKAGRRNDRAGRFRGRHCDYGKPSPCQPRGAERKNSRVQGAQPGSEYQRCEVRPLLGTWRPKVERCPMFKIVSESPYRSQRTPVTGEQVRYRVHATTSARKKMIRSQKTGETKKEFVRQ